MTKNRRHFSAEYKSRVALEAAKGQATLSELASKYELFTLSGGNTSVAAA
jgi:transposase-like protein